MKIRRAIVTRWRALVRLHPDEPAYRFRLAWEKGRWDGKHGKCLGHWDVEGDELEDWKAGYSAESLEKAVDNWKSL